MADAELRALERAAKACPCVECHQRWCEALGRARGQEAPRIDAWLLPGDDLYDLHRFNLLRREWARGLTARRRMKKEALYHDGHLDLLRRAWHGFNTMAVERLNRAVARLRGLRQ